MTLPFSQSVTTLKTVSVAEPSAQTLLTSSPVGFTEGSTTYRTVNLSGAQLQPVQYINSQVDGNLMFGGARYLVPVQQRPAESYVYLSQQPRVVQPVYVQNVQTVRPVSVSSIDESEGFRQISINGQTSVFSHSSSPVKSPVPSENSSWLYLTRFAGEMMSCSWCDCDQLYLTRFAGEMMICSWCDCDQLYLSRFAGEMMICSWCDCDQLYLSRFAGEMMICSWKHLLDPTIDYKLEKDEIESLIPKGVSELTKQQIRYLLQTRVTADKTMRLLMATFSSLREELVHMQEDLRLERDLNFKADQAQQYDRLLETVREHNRQLQASLKESNNAQRSLESQLLGFQSKDPSKDFRIKELEGSKKALEQENELLRKKMAGQCSSSTVQIRTQELSREYEKMLSDLREEKDRELNSMRTQLMKIQTERTIISSSDSGLELRISELLSKLEQRESVIKHQEEEIRRLKQQKIDSSSTTKTVVTQRYMNQYPILGLLSDDYQYTGPVKENRTVVVERKGQVSSRVL
ncbi:hypothetical protein DNTS_024002 [Danionella cerebrum]|uniref:POF1B helix-loop-helix domain-containing protein n=1 Tax=Danionella cerebrum TaxID=2873325 RepID=A0A553MVD0_9TELE|nr:hypothetical protein DNTS_024002 [Danionella translucida]